jgi:hypothetical protein
MNLGVRMLHEFLRERAKEPLFTDDVGDVPATVEI